jgi:hypothetical protein
MDNDNEITNDSFFLYEGMDLLYNDINDINDILTKYKIDEVSLVSFKINLNCSKPFNTFLLSNNFSNELDFPYINTSYVNESPEDFLATIYFYLYSFLLSSNNSGISKYDLESFKNNIEFKGLYIEKNKLYAFVDLTKLEINISLISKNSLCWFALLDEMINKKEVCGIMVNSEVTDFFLNNNAFIYFKDSNGKSIEIPSVVYSGTHEKNLYFNFMFGNTSSDNNAILSSGFYFTDYIHAFRQGGWSKDYKDEFKYDEKITEKENENGKYIKGGLLRYALFLGNNLIKMNYPNDIIDESDIKKSKLSIYDIQSPEYIYEKMTLRISDHDGLWKENYDSVYLGKLELDNGDVLKDGPIYIIKDYHNHTPLSYHYINKNTLGNIFCENENYEIQ